MIKTLEHNQNYEIKKTIHFINKKDSRELSVGPSEFDPDLTSILLRTKSSTGTGKYDLHELLITEEEARLLAQATDALYPEATDDFSEDHDRPVPVYWDPKAERWVNVDAENPTKEEIYIDEDGITNWQWDSENKVWKKLTTGNTITFPTEDEESGEERCERCIHKYCMTSTPGGVPHGPGHYCEDIENYPED